MVDCEGEQPLMVEYTAKREISINSEPVAPPAFVEKLGERLRYDRQKVVFFRAEDDAPYGEVVHLMDLAVAPRPHAGGGDQMSVARAGTGQGSGKS